MSDTASMPLLCRLRHRWDDPPWQPSVGGTYRWRDRTCRRCGAVNREAGPEPTIRGAGMTGPAGRRQSTDEEGEVNVVSQLQGWFFGGQPDGQGRSRSVSNVEVWGFYDGILSGTLDYAGHTGCRFELASDCPPLGDEPRHYIVLRHGKVIGRVTEPELNAARTSDDASS